MGSNDSPKIKVYFDVLGGQYIDKATASYLGLNIDGEYYELSSVELDKLVDTFDIEYELIQIIDNSINEEKKELPVITVYFDDENNYLDKETALKLGYNCDGEYLLLSEKDAIDLYSKYQLEYKLYEGKITKKNDKENPKETLTLYVDEDNAIYIDKDFATLLGIETEINYVELGLGTVETAKKYYNVIFKDLYTKEELPEDVIKSVESKNLRK